MDFQISHLISGGLITNYTCSSRCCHCLYACSPTWEKNYISRATTEQNLKKIKELGCRSIHIGGGEPFLNQENLKGVLELCKEAGMHVDYIETNSSWYHDPDSADALLKDLAKLGVSTLLVSISPMHNEHIPFWKVQGVIASCQRCHVQVFPWVWDFYHDIASFDPQVPHALEEYKSKFGVDYLQDVLARYWIHWGGRAVYTFAKILPLTPWQKLVDSQPGGCQELTNTSHFHFDLYGNYIPGLCAGFAIAGRDLGKPMHAEQYPWLTTLFTQGIQGFLHLVREKYGFTPQPAYLNICHLCLEIRQYLVLQCKLISPELSPVSYYKNLE